MLSVSHVRRRPGADRRLDAHREHVQARHRCRLLGGRAARARAATRATPATTSRSRCSGRVRPAALAASPRAHPLPRRRLRLRRPPRGRGAAARRCARSSASTSASSTARTPPTGAGITPKLADKLLAAGADVITLGNHVWARDEIGPYLAQSERVIRPANVAAGLAGPRAGGRAGGRRDAGRGVNLLGSLFLDVPVGPVRGRRRARRGGAARRRRSSSSTSTPRRRARRSRSPAGSTAG